MSLTLHFCYAEAYRCHIMIGGQQCVRDRAPGPISWDVLGQTHVNGWSRVIVSQNGDSTSYIFPFRLRVLQWSRHLFNYWKNKKTMNENSSFY